MTRETKLGLVVAGTFLVLVGGVVAVRLRQTEPPAETDVAVTAVQEPTPVVAAPGAAEAPAAVPEPEKHNNPVSAAALAMADKTRMPDASPQVVQPAAVVVPDAAPPPAAAAPVMTAPEPMAPPAPAVPDVKPAPVPEAPAVAATPPAPAPTPEPIAPAPATPPAPAPAAPEPQPAPAPAFNNTPPTPAMPDPALAPAPAPVAPLPEPPAPPPSSPPLNPPVVEPAKPPEAPVPATPAPLSPAVASTAAPSVSVIPASGGSPAGASLDPPRGAAVPPQRDTFTTPARPAAPPMPKKDNYIEEQHRWKFGDSFAAISKEQYHDDKYADALLKYNQDYPLASREMRQTPPAIAPGQVVWVPPPRILERDYSQYLGGLAPVTPATPTSRPMVEPVSPPPGLANSGFGNAAPKLYRVRGPAGESLQEIARRTLGNSVQAGRVQQFNPTLSPDPRLPIPAGTVLRLPAEARVETADQP